MDLKNMKLKYSTKKTIWNLLAIFGILSLFLLIVMGGYLTYILTIGNKNQIDKATNSDVRFVLNWCELGDDKIDNVLKSYVSGRSLTGDHHDAYLIKIKDFDVRELQNTRTGTWYRGDELPSILKEAVKYSNLFQEKTPWFIEESEILKSDCYIYPWYIGCHGITPTSTELIICKPKQNLIYFVSVSN